MNHCIIFRYFVQALYAWEPRRVNSVFYASTLWDNASANILKPLISLHKRALKLIINKSSSLTTSDYKKLNILPLRLKLTYNKGIMMHKIMMGCAPPVLSSRFPINQAQYSKSVSIPRLRIDLLVSYSAGSMWNALLRRLKEK